MQTSDITVEVRDRDLNRLGLIAPSDIIVLDVRPVQNNVGKWKLVIALDHPLAWALEQPGAGIIVSGPDDIIMSGPMVTPTQKVTADLPVGELTVEGVCDNIALLDQLAFPQPSNINPATQTVTHDKRTGAAETLLHAYVAANIGPTAPVSRRKAKLTMGTNLGRGPSITKAARFDVLGVLLSEIALVGGLTFRVVQRGANLRFETTEIADKSSTIRLDIRNGTLDSQQVAIAPPGVTWAVVAGQGEGTERQFYTATTAAATAAQTLWGRRIERFIDQRQVKDSDVQIQKAVELLQAEGFTGTSIKLAPSDNTSMRFGRDWNLGDTISVVLGDTEFQAPVTQATLIMDDKGLRVGVVLGDPSGRVGDTVAGVGARLTNLERGDTGVDMQTVRDQIAALTPTIATGSVTVNPVANQPSTVTVTFPSGRFSSTPRIAVSARTSVPGSVVHEVSFNNPTETSFQIVMYRTDSADTIVNWIAVEE